MAALGAPAPADHQEIDEVQKQSALGCANRAEAATQEIPSYGAATVRQPPPLSAPMLAVVA